MINHVGFEIIVFEPMANTSLHESYALLNTSHAMVGVHCTALTHSLFLRPGLIFIQIVPIGVEWASDVFFGRVARGLMLQYFEYKIRKEESNLIERYGKDNILVNDPFAAQKQGWDTKVMDIYLKEQNVNLDLVRFKGHMKEAYKKAKKFISKND